MGKPGPWEQREREERKAGGSGRPFPGGGPFPGWEIIPWQPARCQRCQPPPARWEALGGSGNALRVSEEPGRVWRRRRGVGERIVEGRPAEALAGVMGQAREDHLAAAGAVELSEGQAAQGAGVEGAGRGRGGPDRLRRGGRGERLGVHAGRESVVEALAGVGWCKCTSADGVASLARAGVGKMRLPV